MLQPWACGGCSARNAVGLLRCPRCQALAPQFLTIHVPAAPAAAPRRRKPKAA